MKLGPIDANEMTQDLRIAICQFPVSQDIAMNAKFIRRFMKKAAAAGADLIHFPETALPGYGRLDFRPLDADNWRSLEGHTKRIANLARELGLWVVLGSCRRIVNHEKPANCTHIISNMGQVVGTYDKQKLTPSEFNWFTPGNDVLVISINGTRCGFLICYELQFPELFEAYKKKGVQLVFLSCYNVSRKPRPALQELGLDQIRSRAADNQMWVSAANSSEPYTFSTAQIAGLDGFVRGLRRHVSGILLHDFPDMQNGGINN